MLNDGSRDGTAGVLAGFSDDDRIRVVTKPNSGHGPTILMGYRMAVELADWVFQCDGDDEMDPSHFGELWRVRDDYDALFGSRLDRSQSTGRKLISAVSRVVVHLFYGAGVDDVNTPYRLMRASMLTRILPVIPESTFAPNLVISGAFALAGARIHNLPIPHRNRATGQVSIAKWRLWRASFASLRQTIALASPVRRSFSAATGGPAAQDRS